MAFGFANGNTAIAPSDATDPSMAVTLDATISEDTQYKVTVTEHPIEDGSVIADHVRDEPDELTIQGVVTRTPASLVDMVEANATASFNRDEDAWAWLYAFLKAHVMMSVYTMPKTWENMVITSLKRTRSAAIGEALEVTITLKQITKVVAIETAPPRPDGVQTGKSNKGVGTVKGVSVSILAKAGSWLAQMILARGGG